MLNNYLKSALRFLRHNRVFATINLIGLTIALSASFILLLYVINELSYNHCHKNRSNVYTVLDYFIDYKKTFAITPYVLATALKEQFPQVDKAVRIKSVRGFSLKLKDELIPINDAIATDADIFNIFTLPLISGSNTKNLLDDQNSIVLSKDMSQKLFPGQDPVGKEIVGNLNNVQQVFKVTGVFKNIPENSTLRAQCFINSRWTFENLNKSFGLSNDPDWKSPSWNTWILLSKGYNLKSIENQLRKLEVKYLGEKPTYKYSLQNLGDVYLGSDDVIFAEITGNRNNVRLFSGIAFLILLVAALNYIILSTAISTRRGMEIGVRKTFGAINRSIKNQLLSESVLLTISVFPIALILMRFALPYAGKLFDTNFNIISSNILVYILAYLVLIIIIGVVSGLYTSAYLSKLKVIDTLKTGHSSVKRKQFFRSFLIVVQLVIFCSLVSGTLILHSQYKYALNKDLGYFNKDVLLIEMGRDFKGYSTYINGIKSNPNVICAAGILGSLPAKIYSIDVIPHFQDKNIKVQLERMYIDYNFLKTMGIQVIKGREFSQDFGSDLTQSVILNETAVRELGITDPIGKIVGGQTIIGVVKDFNLHSIHSSIPPLIISITDKNIQRVALHYKTGTLSNTLVMSESEWKKAAPDRPFRFTTIEDSIKDIYSTEKNLSKAVFIFTLFTLLIAAFGLFGLTLFIARSRTKEIGIKKVYGSSVYTIVYSFMLNNFILVLVAALLSVPVTIHFMTKWLNNFAFKTSINPWIFVISFAIAAMVVLLTVLIHSYKASHTNPIEALRNE
jgi:putative ABC transport system permease protein